MVVAEDNFYNEKAFAYGEELDKKIENISDEDKSIFKQILKSLIEDIIFKKESNSQNNRP